VSGVPIAHVGGFPVEETLGVYGPVLLLAIPLASARLRSALRRVRDRREPSDERPAPPSRGPGTSC